MNSINEVIANMKSETAASFDLSEFATRQSGARPRGWYPATVVEGYTAGGHEFLTGSARSSKGDSYNLILCFNLPAAGDKGEHEERTTFAQINYRPVDFNPDRMEVVKRLRKEFAGVRGAWEGFKDEQRSSLALAQLSNFQKATDAPISFSDEGTLIAAPFVGLKLFVRLGIDEETGYNEITGFSKYPNGVEPGKRRRRQKS